MGDLLVFPSRRRIAPARATAYRYHKARSRQLRRELLDGTLRRETIAPLRLLGISMKEASREVDEFCAAVQWEIGTLDAYLAGRPA